MPLLSELSLPPEIEPLSRLARGLVLVGGATGAGKTTTLAALVQRDQPPRSHATSSRSKIRSSTSTSHDRSIVEQVEIGEDAPDFPTALRSAVRQAPDVLVIGEMRDHESMRIALSAAETGHLVFSSLHTTDIASTIARICDSFPNERQNTIRQELALALAAVMTQTLIPKIGGGRVPAAELLMVSYGARQHIRKNALQHLHQEMSITRKQGSLTLEDSLGRLVKSGQITPADAQARAGHPDELDSILRGVNAIVASGQGSRLVSAAVEVLRALDSLDFAPRLCLPRSRGGSRLRRAHRRRGARRPTAGAGTRRLCGQRRAVAQVGRRVAGSAK